MRVTISGTNPFTDVKIEDEVIFKMSSTCPRRDLVAMLVRIPRSCLPVEVHYVDVLPSLHAGQTARSRKTLLAEVGVDLLLHFEC